MLKSISHACYLIFLLLLSLSLSSCTKSPVKSAIISTVPNTTASNTTAPTFSKTPSPLKTPVSSLPVSLQDGFTLAPKDSLLSPVAKQASFTQSLWYATAIVNNAATTLNTLRQKATSLHFTVQIDTPALFKAVKGQTTLTADFYQSESITFVRIICSKYLILIPSPSTSPQAGALPSGSTVPFLKPTSSG